MRISIDVSPAVNGKAGLGRYAGTLAAELARQHPGELHLFASMARGGAWPPDLLPLPRTSVRIGYKPWRMLIMLAQASRFGWDIMLPAPALFHATEHLLLPLGSIPTVMTVHDLIFRHLPQHHKRLNYWFLNSAMPLFVQRASHIIAVSETTRQDLMRLYRTPATKITVVHEAAAPHFAPPPPERVDALRARYGLPDRYLLTVGTVEPRKNLPRLVEALAALRRDDPALRLVVAGADGWLVEGFYAAIEQFGQQEAVIRPGFIPDDDLPALYAGASASVLASLYEGFGLPVLEAMACGCPVACSATSSVGEIAADAAQTFDPENVEGLIDALRQVLYDRDRQDDLRQRGLARAASFSWERAARETWAVYERVIAAG